MNQHLLFILQKIEEIKIAHFKAETDSIVRLPNNVISTLKTDANGYIWFFTACPGPYKGDFDQEAFVTLDYYSKHSNCRLVIHGKAIIEKGREQPSDISRDNIVLLKVKIFTAEYFAAKPTASLKEKIRSAFNYITANHTHKLYDFSS